MDPLEFRMLNAYRDGDMKAHRREAKGCALIECAQVAAERANWPLREEFRGMSSRTPGAARPGTEATRAAAPPTPTAPQRTDQQRPPAAKSPPAGSTHGVQRFSSVFGTRRR
jgi:hypothetical protein